MNAFKHIRLMVFLLVLPMVLGIAALLQAQAPSTTTTVTSPTPAAADPGVRGGPAGGGGPIAGLTARELEFFTAGKAEFEEVEGVADGRPPHMSLASCAGCHTQPASGDTRPFVPQLVGFAREAGGPDTANAADGRVEAVCDALHLLE